MSVKPQNRLEEVLVEAARDQAARPLFYETLIHSELFVIMPAPELGDEVEPFAEGDFTIATVVVEEEEYIPAFSTVERIKEGVGGGFTYVGVPLPDLLEMIQGEKLMLNPGAQVGKEFTLEELEFIMEMVPRVTEGFERLEPEGEVLIGEPEVYPDKLVEKLTALFKTLPQVQRAWVANVMIPSEDEKPHSLVALEVSEDIEGIVKQAAAVSMALTVPDPPVDYLEVTGEGGLEEYFLEEGAPFYVKGDHEGA